MSPSLFAGTTVAAPFCIRAALFVFFPVAGCYACILILLYARVFVFYLMSFSHDAMVWSVMCDCYNSWSYNYVI